MRWSSKLHGKTTHLTWADGESFTVDERQEITEDTMVEEMLEAVREVAGASWTTIIDVADGTAATHKVYLSRIVPRLGARTLDSLEAADVATLVEELNEAGLKRESIRKTIAALAIDLRLREGRPQRGTRPDDDQAPPRGQGRTQSTDGGARARRASAGHARLPPAAARARRKRHASRRTRSAEVG
jgi:hypothetical protein